ncbi:MAG: branched-chain amino acid ABC transporter permease [Candidatus Pacebacteria bacterium]|nr:branched-chain amino acid ABC transporter permease [Candidatus Paceibacterota bacterium]MDD5357235.1 branched-chain amino acid ABC transporter permease [Candidatus Paceibacterota bacterium]
MPYLIHLLILISIYAILAISLDLVVGFSGFLSLAHAAFFGIGAYVTAILLTSLGINFFLAAFIGALISAFLALCIGAVLSKFKGDFYALASLGFGVIVYSVFLNWQDLTRGPLGIPGIPRPAIFGFAFADNFWFLVLALVVTLLVFLFSHFVTGSSFGRVLKAIREDEQAISVFGYNVLLYKLAIFVIAAALAAFAGSLYAAYITFIDPSTFTVTESIFILSTVILGGLASHRGAVLGAAVLILLPEFLRFVGFPTDIAAQMRQVVYGVLLVVLMMYKPQGLLGEYKL